MAGVLISRSLIAISFLLSHSFPFPIEAPNQFKVGPVSRREVLPCAWQIP